MPPGVTVVDGGTGGFHLLSYLTAGEPVILDIGLRDLVEAAALTGSFPRILLVTVSIASIESMVMTLSPPVAAALPAVEEKVRELARSLGSTGGASPGPFPPGA